MATMYYRIALLLAATAVAQPPGANYDESKVPNYKLPDPLRLENGEPVRDARTWREKRRPELIRLFEQNIHGKSPAAPKLRSEITSIETQALAGKAVRKQIRVMLAAGTTSPKMDLLVYLPAKAKGRVPVFLSLNFTGNHTVWADPGIALPESWMPRPPNSPDSREAAEKRRGTAASRWPVERILERGYGVATAYYGDIEPDHAAGFDQSVRKAYLKPGQDKPAPGDWAAIAAWAWGLSRAMDYLETDPAVDRKRVAVLGHSRLGKAALWAGAMDERFAAVISNDSGEGGAAISRRKFGEQVADLNKRFPHWFTSTYSNFDDREDALPVDMHQLIALVAPRPVYVASASEDLWADPHGEFLSAKAASPVYKLLTGSEGLSAAEMPGVEMPVLSRIGHHVRKGKHDITLYDWDRFMDFTDKWMK